MNRAIDIGRPFGCWTYVRECHWGERSAVYMVAHVKEPGRVAALKICTDTDEESVRAFRREISNTRLRLLPGRMPEVLDEGERDGMPYYVMTFGEDVDVECKSEKTAVSVALFLIECCIELRRLGYVHGDLKPENVGVEVGPDGTRRYVLPTGRPCARCARRSSCRPSSGRLITGRRRPTTKACATSGRRSTPSA